MIGFCNGWRPFKFVVQKIITTFYQSALLKSLGGKKSENNARKVIDSGVAL